jgi:hypothetical protein
MSDHEKIISDWAAAYEAANGAPPTGEMKYGGGWYRTRWNAFRRKEVLAITSALQARAKVAAR